MPASTRTGWVKERQQAEEAAAPLVLNQAKFFC
jgi:hypothetical protein